MNLFFLFLIYILMNHFTRIQAKAFNGEIDDFINKLLRSDKFDELAEKIAEKAARKIFDLDHIRISHNIQTKKEKPPYNMSKHKSLRERDKEDNFEENTKEESNETESNEKFQLKDTNHKLAPQNKEFHIKQIINKEIPPSKNQLRLNFKNLSKASRGNSNKHQETNNETEIHKNKIELQNKKRILTKDKQLKSRFEKVNRKENQIKTNGNSSEKGKISDEDSIEENKENNSEVDGKNNVSHLGKDSNEKNKSDPETAENNNENNKEIIEKKYNRNKDSGERLASQNQVVSLETDNDNLNKNKLKSKDDVSRKTENRAVDISEIEKDNDSYDKDLEAARKSNKMSTRKLIIRREGDKLIAFENQSDYKEYEEEVANQKVQRKEILL